MLFPVCAHIRTLGYIGVKPNSSLLLRGAPKESTWLADGLSRKSLAHSEMYLLFLCSLSQCL